MLLLSLGLGHLLISAQAAQPAKFTRALPLNPLQIYRANTASSPSRGAEESGAGKGHDDDDDNICQVRTKPRTN